MPTQLQGRVVAITGGARGIGRATAEHLVRRGAKVAIGDIDAELAARTAEEIGSGVVATALDVTDRASFTAFLDETEARLGPLDVLVNNAGIMPIGPFHAETDGTTRRLVDINIHGVLLGCKLALPRMLPRRTGHLVNISSAAGRLGLPGEATYCATKFAVYGLSESLRFEYRDAGIEVSCVMPNLANTELGAGMKPARFQRLISPDEVAAAIVSAVERPRFDVYVPRDLGWSLYATALLPRPLREAVGRFLGVDKVGTVFDETGRAAYHARSTVAEAIAEARAQGFGAPTVQQEGNGSEPTGVASGR